MSELKPLSGTIIPHDDIVRMVIEQDFLHPQNPFVPMAIRVTAELEEWLENQFNSYRPVANLRIDQGTLAILIGEDVVYDSQEDAHTEITLEACKANYQEYVNSLRELFDDKPDGGPAPAA